MSTRTSRAAATGREAAATQCPLGKTMRSILKQLGSLVLVESKLRTRPRGVLWRCLAVSLLGCQNSEDHPETEVAARWHVHLTNGKAKLYTDCPGALKCSKHISGRGAALAATAAMMQCVAKNGARRPHRCTGKQRLSTSRSWPRRAFTAPPRETKGRHVPASCKWPTKHSVSGLQKEITENSKPMMVASLHSCQKQKGQHLT